MACFACRHEPFRANSFRSISKAMAKGASARLRQLSIVPTATDWAGRAAICERCPKQVVRDGVSYCGTPFLRMVRRDPVVDGCGCPTRAKAKSPKEHCPIDTRFSEAKQIDGKCTCRWCAA